jgi:hypothetical protein
VHQLQFQGKGLACMPYGSSVTQGAWYTVNKHFFCSIDPLLTTCHSFNRCVSSRCQFTFMLYTCDRYHVDGIFIARLVCTQHAASVIHLRYSILLAGDLQLWFWNHGASTVC